jgi:hypothetical protein
MVIPDPDDGDPKGYRTAPPDLRPLTLGAAAAINRMLKAVYTARQ